MTQVKQENPLEETRFRGWIRIKRLLARLLLLIYLVCALVSGYWYWTRPVRADQFRHAHLKWHEIAEIFGVPVPKDERW